MEDLIKRIERTIEMRKFCMVSARDLTPLWQSIPALSAEQLASLEVFARQHGWDISIHDPGIRVTFKNSEKSRSSHHEVVTMSLTNNQLLVDRE